MQSRTITYSARACLFNTCKIWSCGLSIDVVSHSICVMCIGLFGSWVLLQEPERNRWGLRGGQNGKYLTLCGGCQYQRTKNYDDPVFQFNQLVYSMYECYFRSWVLLQELEPNTWGRSKGNMFDPLWISENNIREQRFLTLENLKSVAAFVFIEIRTLPPPP